MAYSYLQGLYVPKNPQKYIGDVKRISYRSSWELHAFKWCDFNHNVIQWNSEEVVIPYRSPVDGRMHRYYVDLRIHLKTEGGFKVILAEIKPLAQTKEPKRGSNPERYAEQYRTYMINQAKWASARAYAKERGWGFVILTEDHLLDGVQNDKELKHRMREHHKKVKEERTALAKRKERARQAAEGIKQRIREEASISSAQQSASQPIDP